MIENGIISWLDSYDELVEELGGHGHVYLHSAPMTKAVSGAAPAIDVAKMPWIIVRNSGGKRLRDSGVSIEERDTLTLYIDDPARWHALTLALLVRKRLENFRGNIYNAAGRVEERDVFIECDPARDDDGFQGAVRYNMAIYVRYRQPITRPR